MADFTFLKTALAEYIDSLARMDGEKDHQAAIVAQAKERCDVEPGRFKKLAAAMHKDKLDHVYLDAGEMMALVDILRSGKTA